MVLDWVKGKDVLKLYLIWNFNVVNLWSIQILVYDNYFVYDKRAIKHINDLRFKWLFWLTLTDIIFIIFWGHDILTHPGHAGFKWMFGPTLTDIIFIIFWGYDIKILKENILMLYGIKYSMWIINKILLKIIYIYIYIKTNLSTHRGFEPVTYRKECLNSAPIHRQSKTPWAIYYLKVY